MPTRLWSGKLCMLHWFDLWKHLSVVINQANSFD
jgi:hypothetical protein